MSYQTPPGPASPYQPSPRTEVSAGTAFKIGFFGAFGVMCASLIVGIVLAVIGAVLGASFFGAF